MKHELAAFGHSFCEIQIRQIAFDKLDARNVIQIAALSGDQRIGDADAMSSANQFLRQV